MKEIILARLPHQSSSFPRNANITEFRVYSGLLKSEGI